jgi:GT2 family glycosyltransferase
VTLHILIPFYGDLKLLQEAVRSVLAQQDTRWLLTVVDDRYPDPAVTIWFEDLLEDTRIRYVRNEVNLGANRNFQRCLDLAEAEYITILGGDDLLMPNYVGTILSVMETEPGVAIVQPGVCVIDGEGRPARTLVDSIKAVLAGGGRARRVLTGERLATSLLHGDWLYFPALCWRTESARRIGFPTDLHTIMDLALILGVVTDGGRLVTDPTPAFYYRRHAASESSWRATAGSRFAEERAFFQMTAECLEMQGWPRAARAARWHLTSRLHATLLLPRALVRGDRSAVALLFGHAVGGRSANRRPLR